MDPVTLGMAKAATAKAVAQLRRRDCPGYGALPTLMASPPATAQGAANAATAITSSLLVPMNEPGAFSYFGPVTPLIGSTSFYTSALMYSQSTATPWAAEFWFDTADTTGRFEIKHRGQNGAVRVLVANSVSGAWQYVTQLQTFKPPADGNVYLGLVTLGAPGRYRIRLEMDWNFFFGGIQCGPTDTVSATTRKLQRWLVIGDSFTEPTITDTGGYVAWDGWPQRLGYALGVDMYSCGLGGTGYLAAPMLINVSGTGSWVFNWGGQTATIAAGASLATVSTALQGMSNIGAGNVSVNGSVGAYTVNLVGALAGTPFTGATINSAGITGGSATISSIKVKFRDRIADVVSSAPDAVVICGGINDFSLYTTAQMTAESLLLFQALKAALPSAAIYVCAGSIKAGFQLFLNNALASRDGFKASGATAGITAFLDNMSLPISNPPATTTLQADAAAGATSVSIGVNYPIGTYFQIGSTATAEVRRCQGVTGTGPYTIAFNGTGGSVLANAHTAGEPITPCGPAIYTGTGKQGTPANNGNADRYTGSDSTHPTVLGHDNWARQLFRLIHRTLPA